MTKPPRYQRRRRSPPGTPPGTLTADPDAGETRVRAIRFNAEGVSEDDSLAPCAPGSILWLNIDGLADTDLLQKIGTSFGLHPLALEDVVNVHQRPKAEEYEAHQFIVLRMPEPGQDGLHTEQVSIFLGDGFVITVQEHAGDVFDPVRTRLRNPLGQMRKRGADYLCYALVDAAIDAYFPVLEALGEKLEQLEDTVVFDPDAVDMGDIHVLKRELMSIRSAILPMRDVVATLQREETQRFSDNTRLYLRDCQDHAVQLIETIQTYREIATGLVDILLSSQSNRANEVMQVLTLIATIFIPLTFIVGVYGMNFDDMPELHWRYGYPAVMGIMGLIAVVLAIWFYRKGWLGRR
ncbi:magnesium/cobalt transporter CorA [Pararhodobacter zhoushanensis]|uniref:Magnesium transport protein CorA n=1 Tax=Pararhodobacter zhoushanensis TaxID=2479545 RepID=A0ABT3GUB5_9RHOB|nr:magnesium/cobalt transporter CorA [Pararhodobacter zhoushanensis]MCW1931127.1 magnesium/cobalt transporter CorA [Pararhodobacter zhoushanensis]